MCVVDLESKVKCYGNNIESVIDVPKLIESDVDGVYAGSSHTCLVKLNGKV